jgi:hypothetical protein
MAARSGRTMRWRSPQRRKARPVSPVPQHAHFLGATTLDLCRTFTVNVHHAVPRCATRFTAALRNDGVEDVAAVALVEDHARTLLATQRLNPVPREIVWSCQSHTEGLTGARRCISVDRQARGEISGA